MTVTLADRRWRAIRWLHSLAERLSHAFASADATAGTPGADAAAAVRPLAQSAGGTPERPSLDALYRKYSGSLYWVCLKYVKNEDDARDMVNQVFLKVHGSLDGFRGQSRIYSWMYRIAINECIGLFRKRKFEVDGESIPGFEDLLHTTPEGRMDAKLLLEKLTKDADPETVEILFLLYLEGLTQEEVVEKLGISRTTVHRKVTAFKAAAERFR